MKKLNILVCENYKPEFEKVVEKEQFGDVIINAYPCLCECKGNLSIVQKRLKQLDQVNNDTALVCSQYCDILKQIPQNVEMPVIYSSEYCFSHLASKPFIEYIIEKRGYIISSGWLDNWQSRLKNEGFDRKTGQKFYQEFCTDLVFFDLGIDDHAEDKLKALSDYLEIPFKIIPFELESIQLFLRSVVYEWRLNKKDKEDLESNNELRKQSAEYAAILNLMEQISSAENQREVIEKLKEVFLFVFGAQTCRFWSLTEDDSNRIQKIKDLFLNTSIMYCSSQEKNEYFIKIKYNEEIFGVLEVGGFLFPQHSEKYLNLSIAIVKVSALVLSNVRKYETLVKSKNDVIYTSFHDALTGLYNRTYFNKISSEYIVGTSLAVFMCDIDGMKYVNDNFGHAEGDKLLGMAADVLKQSFRETDMIARIGGDEFVVIVPDCDDQKAVMLNGRIMEAVSISNQQNDRQLSISVGYAIPGNKDVTMEHMVNEADRLMYINKTTKKLR